MAELPDRVHHVPGSFTFCLCARCGLVYLNPRPTATSFSQMYPEQYGPYQPAAVTPEAIHDDIRRTCGFVERIQPAGGTLLDVGCGPGTFIQALQLLAPHWQVAGVEPDERAATYARAQGLAVQHAIFEQAQLQPASWDAVSFWNVLEHLPDPLAALRSTRALLRRKGILYLAIPLWDSWDARIWRDYWMGWDPPRHFMLLDRKTLSALLHQAGYNIVASACLSGSEYCFTESMRLYLHERVQRYALRRLAIATSYSRPFRLLLKPYVWLVEAMKRSTVLTVAARPID